MRALTFILCALGLVPIGLASCGDDDAKGGASSGTSGSGPNGTGNFPGVDPATTANGTCPYDSSTATGTATHGFTIPNNHPRLWWTPERIERAKGWLRDHPVKAKPEEYLNVAFLHVVAGQSCKEAIDWALSVKLEDEFNVGSNELRWFGENVILVWDWCNDELTPQQKSTLMPRWSDYFKRAAALEWGGPTMQSNNYYWGYMRNEIQWGIAAHGEDPEAPKLLEFGLVNRWEKSFLPFAKGTDPKRDGRGGVPHEGTQYGQYQVNYPVNPFGSAHLLGRSLYDETDFFKGSVFYVIYSTTQGPTTNPVDNSQGFDMFPFNDDEGWKNRNTAIANRDFMAHAAQTWHCLPVGKYARAWSKMVKAEPPPYIVSVDKGGEELDLAGLPLDYYAPGPKYYYGRSKWGAAGTSFNWQLGDYYPGGVGHSHNDLGNFQIWRGGRWLTRETASYSADYTGFGGEGTSGASDTISHNTILMNGMGNASPSGGEVDGPPVVTRLESQAEYAYAVVDMTKTYRNTTDPNHPDRDNAAAGHVEREIVFLRGLETTVVLDRLESKAVSGKSAEQVEKTFLAHFELEPTLSGNHLTYTSGSQALDLTVLVPSNAKNRVIDEKSHSSDSSGLYRLEVNVSGAAQSHILTVLQAKDTGAPALVPTALDNGTSYTVTLDGNTSLVFQKGMKSTGGSITVNGTTKQLRADVQGIKITDAGPAWL